MYPVTTKLLIALKAVRRAGGMPDEIWLSEDDYTTIEAEYLEAVNAGKTIPPRIENGRICTISISWWRMTKAKPGFEPGTICFLERGASHAIVEG
jgi:hypothetical protein